MVTFSDPLTGKELSYHIDPKIKGKWDGIRGGKLAKLDEDRVYIVDGRERMGKSLFTLQQAKYIDPTFNISRVCFTPDEFLHQIRTVPKGSVVIFDEAFRGLSSKGSQSKINKKIVQAMMEVGQRNLIIFIVLPTFFLLEIYAAVLRSNALFHIFKDKKGLRRIRIYNESKKSQLYFNGKKKGYTYAFPKVKFSARFFKKYPINEQDYRDKKHKALLDTEKEMDDPEDNRFKEERKVFLVNMFLYLKKHENLTQKEFCERLKEVGIELTQGTLSIYLVKARKDGKILNIEEKEVVK